MLRIQSGGGAAPFGSRYSSGRRATSFKTSSSSAAAVKPMTGHSMVPTLRDPSAPAQRTEAVYEMILRNSRFPEVLQGDIDAEVAAVEIGARRIRELCRRYGADTVEAAFQEPKAERAASPLPGPGLA